MVLWMTKFDYKTILLFLFIIQYGNTDCHDQFSHLILGQEKAAENPHDPRQ